MNFLLDTHLLLWASSDPTRLSARARELIVDLNNTLRFSSISIAEIAIKQALQRADFQADPTRLRDDLVRSGYLELPFNSDHAVALATLPTIHKDPFDRILVAQAMVEQVPLLTMDATLADYPGPIWKV